MSTAFNRTSIAIGSRPRSTCSRSWAVTYCAPGVRFCILDLNEQNASLPECGPAETIVVAAYIPLPVRYTVVCSSGNALSTTRIEAWSSPFARGVNTTVTVQLAPGFRLVRQSFVCVKPPKPAWVPIRILEIDITVGPTLLRVNDFAALWVPTGTSPKS